MWRYLFRICICLILLFGNQQAYTTPIDSTKLYIAGASNLNFPFAFEEGQKAKGFSVDLLNAIAEEYNLPIKLNIGDWDNIYGDFKKKKIDILFAVSYSTERNTFMDFSSSYMTINFSIFSNNRSNIKNFSDLNNKSIVVSNKGIMHEWLIENQSRLTNTKIITVHNGLEAMKAVNSGMYDACLLTELVGEYLIDKNSFKNISDKKIKVFSDQLRFAVQEENSELLFVLGEGILWAQNNGTLQKLQDKWFSDNSTQLSNRFKKFIIVLIILAFILVIISIALKKQVSSKTIQLKQALTEKEQSLLELNQKENLFKEIIENMPFAVDAVNNKGEVVFWNKAIEDITGYSKDEMIGNNQYLRLYYRNDADRELADQQIEELRKANKEIQLQRELTDAKGNKKTILSNIIFDIIPVSDWKSWSLSIDITDKINAEINLKTIQEKYQQALQAIDDGLWEWNVSTGEVYYSERWFTMLQYEHNEFSPHIDSWIKLIHEEDRENIIAENLEKASSGDPYYMEFRMKNKAGKYIWIRSRSRSIYFNQYGKPLTILGINTNITKEKQIEQELITAKEKAEESDMLKSAFLANMSHEIRTPLNGIMGFTQIIAAQTKDEAFNEYLNIIKSNSYQLLNLVNDILDISKIEVNQLKIDLVEFNLYELLSETILIQEKTNKTNTNISLIEKLDKLDKFLLIKSDPHRLKQIVNNLINNAFKFTVEGHIILEAVQKNGSVMISVTDTGIGIPADKVNHIFDRFVQVDSKVIYTEGAGLGLTISYELCRLLSSVLQVESELGEGTKFFFEIPTK